MKKFLLCAFAAAISFGASAETMRLASITDVASGGGTDDVTKLEYDAEGRLVKASDDESVCT
ncbi:MAG: RHS repeat protein, partial [Muribaculaceae bacterium]|nr:RHS repeat protein [Muribaculaceae bacterium]